MRGKPKLNDILHGTRRALWIFGLYSGKDLKGHCLAIVMRAITLTVTTCFPILIATRLFLEKQDLSSLLSTSLMALMTTWFISKLILYLGRLPELYVIDELLELDIFDAQNERQYGYVTSAIRNQVRLAGCLWFLGSGVVLGLSIYPIADKQPLIIPIWTPVDLETSRTFWYLYEVYTFVTMMVVYIALDCMVIGLIAIIAIQFKILRDNIEHATDNNLKKTRKGQERVIQDRLKKCVIHHNALLGLIQKTENVLSSILFYQVLVYILGICLAGLHLILVPAGSMEFITISVDFVDMVFLIGLPCWYGQDVITESSKIAESCYTCTWYICSASTKRIIFIIMEKAKEPIVLRGGRFFSLSLNTFLMILRNAYSYFTVLNQLYRK